MSDLKLFRLGPSTAVELHGASVDIEKSLQTLIERNMETMLGVRLLASEHNTGKTHGGRIDSLGLDENGCPVIVEYKRSMNENVMNQGLFYLDWLLDHRAEFELLVQKRLGQEVADSIEWTSPRLLCVAGDFTTYDEHAVKQIDRNIGLIRYRRFEDDLLLLELVNATTSSMGEATVGTKPKGGGGRYRTVSEALERADQSLRDRFETLKAFLLGLGDDVQLNTLRYYFAFKRLRNFACVEVHPQVKKITVFVKIDPEATALEEGFSRDVRKIGHFGTGELEITIDSDNDLGRAKPFLIQSYEVS